MTGHLFDKKFAGMVKGAERQLEQKKALSATLQSKQDKSIDIQMRLQQLADMMPT